MPTRQEYADIAADLSRRVSPLTRDYVEYWLDAIANIRLSIIQAGAAGDIEALAAATQAGFSCLSALVAQMLYSIIVDIVSGELGIGELAPIDVFLEWLAAANQPAA